MVIEHWRLIIGHLEERRLAVTGKIASARAMRRKPVPVQTRVEQPLRGGLVAAGSRSYKRRPGSPCAKLAGDLFPLSFRSPARNLQSHRHVNQTGHNHAPRHHLNLERAKGTLNPERAEGALNLERAEGALNLERAKGALNLERAEGALNLEL
jgi:hypothetical protein